MKDRVALIMPSGPFLHYRYYLRFADSGAPDIQRLRNGVFLLMTANRPEYPEAEYPEAS